jgi:hypothetical protein
VEARPFKESLRKMNVCDAGPPRAIARRADLASSCLRVEKQPADPVWPEYAPDRPGCRGLRLVENET